MEEPFQGSTATDQEASKALTMVVSTTNDLRQLQQVDDDEDGGQTAVFNLKPWSPWSQRNRKRRKTIKMPRYLFSHNGLVSKKDDLCYTYGEAIAYDLGEATDEANFCKILEAIDEFVDIMCCSGRLFIKIPLF